MPGCEREALADHACRMTLKACMNVIRYTQPFMEKSSQMVHAGREVMARFDITTERGKWETVYTRLLRLREDTREHLPSTLPYSYIYWCNAPTLRALRDARRDETRRDL